MLRDINLTIEPGETVAIVGLTGSGKSTSACLPPRLYDVTQGGSPSTGIDVRDITIESLRRHVAVVFEDPVLFSMSVRENLVLGRPDASDGEIADALELAQAGFVRDLPWGLDTRIGEQGLALSGDSASGWHLARAVLARPSVLVLDDPLSALDVNTEALVEQSLARVLLTRPAFSSSTGPRRSPSRTGWRSCATGFSSRSGPTTSSWSGPTTPRCCRSTTTARGRRHERGRGLARHSRRGDGGGPPGVDRAAPPAHAASARSLGAPHRRAIGWLALAPS